MQLCYSPRNRVYCIYGIGFTAEKYEEEVLYNNNASPYIDQLEAATIPACKSNLHMEAEYGGGWIKMVTANKGTSSVFKRAVFTQAGQLDE
ncbi:hypothetical protein Tcan_11270 [Toxocara canis]|uniref:Uncharacterized protein n=1 Tax=Toxocara canis TaxID=6265 RepID=A0A0B2V2X2_TOXCA|nr:hypothetical protein Tcan_11270 [Toxocara canis]